MGSVEVLKGPQGTLFGASALNGAVRYVPTPPKFGRYEVKWFGQYTSIYEGDAGPSYGAAVNLPFGDTLALRVMAFDRSEEHTSDLQSLMRNSYAVFCLKKKKTRPKTP